MTPREPESQSEFPFPCLCCDGLSGCGRIISVYSHPIKLPHSKGCATVDLRSKLSCFLDCPAEPHRVASLTRAPYIMSPLSRGNASDTSSPTAPSPLPPLRGYFPSITNNNSLATVSQPWLPSNALLCTKLVSSTLHSTHMQ